MKNMLITGGTGFIGTNTALAFAKKGWNVTILDTLSRKGSKENLSWLKENCDISFKKIDIRNSRTVEKLFARERFDAILHLAAQVAVTASILNPRQDFEINALGTFNILEAARRFCPEAHIIYASTNKVYGEMKDITVIERNGRYEYQDLTLGIDENQPLDFHSPYGCSKGCADQYVLDYVRIYGLCATSFRQSCIYGPRQFGIEDQGWVAWFNIAAVKDRPITIYGDGKQVRDLLHVDDLIRAFESAISHPEKISGQAFNIGGGADNTLSVLQLVGMIEKEIGKKLKIKFDKWRAGDQKVFICDLSKIKKVLSWEPRIGIKEGQRALFKWVRENKNLFKVPK